MNVAELWKLWRKTRDLTPEEIKEAQYLHGWAIANWINHGGTIAAIPWYSTLQFKEIVKDRRASVRDGESRDK